MMMMMMTMTMMMVMMMMMMMMMMLCSLPRADYVTCHKIDSGASCCVGFLLELAAPCRQNMGIQSTFRFCMWCDNGNCGVHKQLRLV